MKTLLSFAIILALLSLNTTTLLAEHVHCPPDLPPPSIVTDREAWRFYTGKRILSTAAVSKSSVYFGDNSGTLFALDKRTGRYKWSFEIPEEGARIRGGIVLAEDKVIFASQEAGVLYALNRKSGDVLWRVDVGGTEQINIFDFNSNTPIVVGKTVYFGSKAGSFYAINLKRGTVDWQLDLAVRFYGLPAVKNRTLLISSDKGLHSINLRTRKENWFHLADNPSSPGITRNIVAVGTRRTDGGAGSQRTVDALDITNGELLWQVPYQDTWVTGSVVGKNGTFYVGLSDGRSFEAIDAHTGTIEWSSPTEANVVSRPAIHHNTVYVSSGIVSGGQLGFLKAFERSSGEELWSIQGDTFISSPILDDGIIYIGNRDGYFYAIRAD